MYARNPPHLDGEPKLLEAEKLDAPRKGTDRATRSILNHNEIIWHSGGFIAQKDADITDLGLNGSRDASAPPGEGGIPRCESVLSDEDRN